jgi:hypothetical protein
VLADESVLAEILVKESSGFWKLAFKKLDSVVRRKPRIRVPMQNMHCMKAQKWETGIKRKEVSDACSELKPLRFLLRIRARRWEEPVTFFILNPLTVRYLLPLHQLLLLPHSSRLALYRILIKLDSSAKTTKGHKYC